MKKNKGKKNTKYSLCLVRRGHVNNTHFDIVVKLNRNIVEKLGYMRWYKDIYMNYFKKDRLIFWISQGNIVYSKGFKRILIKIVNTENINL